MIATVACALAMSADFSVGQKWDYVLTYHFTGENIDTTDEESLLAEIIAVRDDSVTLRIQQRLTASIFGEQRIPTDPKTVPASHDWALFKNGSVAFIPDGRFALESRVFRVIKGILPAPKGDAIRDREWSINMPEDGQGLPAATLKAKYLKLVEKDTQFSILYREPSAAYGVGLFQRYDKSPLPKSLDITFRGVQMPGGTDIVNCDFKMRLASKK